MIRRRARAVLGVVVLVAGLALGTAAAPAGAATASAKLIFQHSLGFTGTGKADSTQEAVANELDSVFSTVRSNWDVYISMYYITDNRTTSNDVVDRLLTAIWNSHARLHVVMSNGSAPVTTAPPAQAAGCPSTTGGADPKSGWTAASARLRCIVTTDQKFISGGYGGQFGSCQTACLDHPYNYGIDHNKFVLFSGPAGQRIVFSSSANWSQPQLADKYQTAVEVRNSTGLFNSFLAYWKAEYAGRGRTSASGSNPSYGNTHSYSNADEHLSAYYTPSTATNIYQSTLNKVTCRSGDTVDIATNGFNITGVANRIKVLRSAHCAVHVLADITGPNLSAATMTAIGARCITLLHRKDLIIDSHYSDGTTDHNVLTGTLPFQSNGPKWDNSLLRLQGLGYLPQFENEFATVWARGAAWTSKGCTPRA